MTNTQTHNLSVYHASGSYESARGDCTCGWTTGLQVDDGCFAYVKREAAGHEKRTTRKEPKS